MLNDCHTSVQRLSLQAAKSQKAQNDQRSLPNVVQATAIALQDLTTKFRKCQSTYLHSKFFLIVLLYVLSVSKILNIFE